MSRITIGVIALLAAMAGVLPSRALCGEYIVMGTPMVNIRTGPGKDHVIIGRAEKGDIYRVIETADGWHKIEMFAGDPRYVVALRRRARTYREYDRSYPRRL